MTYTLTNTYFINVISKVSKFANFQNNNCMRLMTIKIILLGTCTCVLGTQYNYLKQ